MPRSHLFDGVPVTLWPVTAAVMLPWLFKNDQLLKKANATAPGPA